MILRRLWRWLTDRWDPDHDETVVQLHAQAEEVRAEIRRMRDGPIERPHGNDWLEIADTGRLSGDEGGRR